MIEVRSILKTAAGYASYLGLNATIGIHREKSHLMRIGNNSVSLSTAEELTRIDINVTKGSRQATHTQLSEVKDASQIKNLIDIAYEKIKVSRDADFTPYIEKVEKEVNESFQYDKSLEELDPVNKSKLYSDIFNELGNNYNYSGSWSSGMHEQYLISTENENIAFHKGTDQAFNIVLKHPVKKWELSAWQSGWKVDDVSKDAVISSLKGYLDTYEKNEGHKVGSGEYTVVFGPNAIAELLEMMMYTGFWGRIWEEKQAWTSKNKFGDLILGENINIYDDPDNPDTFGYGFDLSGMSRKKFPIVENGKFSGLMYDSVTAAKYKRKMTGHNLSSWNIVMETGKGPECPLEAVKDIVGKVLYIPALHYINLPNITKGIVTGSSRFNALLIEKGEIVSPIFSSRVTDSFMNLFGNVKIISPKATSLNLSGTYGRRSPVSFSVPAYMVSEKVRITDSADSF